MRSHGKEKESRHGKSISGDAKEYFFTTASKRTPIILPNHGKCANDFKQSPPMNSPQPKKQKSSGRGTSPSVTQSHCKKKKPSPHPAKVLNLEDEKSLGGSPLTVRGRGEENSKEKSSHGIYEPTSVGIHVTKELIDSLASLRMDTASLKAVLSNEQFRIKQNCTKETRLIEDTINAVIEKLESLKKSYIERLTSQSSHLLLDITASIKKVSISFIKVDSGIKALDKVFDSLPANSYISYAQSKLLSGFLSSARLEIPSEPKVLTLSEVSNDETNDIGSEICKVIEDKLNFQTFEQDQTTKLNFNDKIKKINSILECSSIGQYFPTALQMHDPKSMNSLDQSIELIDNGYKHSAKRSKEKRVSQSTRRRKAEKGNDHISDKENIWLNLPSEMALAQNQIDKIPLDSEERLKMFAGLSGGKQNQIICERKSSRASATELIDNLECFDEVLPPRNNLDNLGPRFSLSTVGNDELGHTSDVIQESEC